MVLQTLIGDSLAHFEHQSGQDHLPFVATHQVVVLLVPIVTLPVKEGNDPSGR